ncbi:MAG: hypothetical protein V1848_01025 [Candidatus Magasanikbacteria bacterium]
MKKAIIDTLSYFDIFHYPLTREELFSFLWKESGKVHKSYFFEELSHLVEKQEIGEKNGLYFLLGSENATESRMEKEWILHEKIKRAQRAVQILQYIPYIRAVFLCNQFFISTRNESDIDVLIITQPRRIWMVRFFSLFFMGLLRMRIKKGKEKNKICLSFFVTEDSLNFSSLALPEKDIYLAYWIVNLVPLMDPHTLYQRILKENKYWLKHFLPNIREEYMFHPLLRVKENFIIKYIRIFFERGWRDGYGDLVQEQMMEMQKKKLEMNNLLKDREDKSIVVNDHMLKFHGNDRRLFYKNEWIKRIEMYGQK